MKFHHHRGEDDKFRLIVFRLNAHVLSVVTRIRIFIVYLYDPVKIKIPSNIFFFFFTFQDTVLAQINQIISTNRTTTPHTMKYSPKFMLRIKSFTSRRVRLII